MRTPKVKGQDGKGEGKPNKQLIILGGLVAMLGVVLISQFSGDDEKASASTAPIEVDEAAVADARAEVAADGNRNIVGNAVLSQASGADALNDGVFKSFWNVATPVVVEVKQTPPPSITIDGTLTPADGEDSGARLAVIDGRIRREGELIGGWALASIQRRAVTLRSSSNQLITVSMPILGPGSVKSMANAWGAAAGEGLVTGEGQATDFTADAIAGALGGMFGGSLDESLVETLTESIGGGVAGGAIDFDAATKPYGDLDVKALNNMSAEELVKALAGGTPDR